MKVGFVSLGCSKNLIDTEMMIGVFKNNNFTIVADPAEAEVIVVNTCGFIESAKEEAINTILEMAEYKKIGKCKILIATGCLVERYKEELEKAISEVDIFLKYSDYAEEKGKSAEIFANVLERIYAKYQNENNQKTENTELNFMDRVVTTGKNYAYLKIGEGCSNRCTYCAIPYIRGPFVSRKKEEIIKEAKELAKKGIKEIIVIAQDTTKYGVDIYGESKLAEILEEISKIDEIKWIRFLYSYPEGITDELINVVANNPKIAKYFDIPIQHISDEVLKRMNRRTNKKQITNLIEKIREKIPEVTLRTSLIVGFPGETKEQFDELLDFVGKAKFDKLGVFMYSKEDGTPAAKLPEQVHTNTKKSRYNKIMKKQQEVSCNNLENRMGNIEEVLIEEKSFDGKYYIGRTFKEVPDIDGLIYISNSEEIDEKEVINNFEKVKIVSTSEYDLIGEFSK